MMKISFSTLACPEYAWTDIYTMAKDIGFDGIEIRGLGHDIHAVNAQPFSDSKIVETIGQLKKLNLEIPCLSSGCKLCDFDRTEDNLAEIKSYVELAAKLGTPYIRILADGTPEPRADIDDSKMAEVLKRAASLTNETGITLLVETNGVYSDTARLRALLDAVADEHVAALWDVHHPYRYAHEEACKPIENLGSYIKYVHIKDSIECDGKIEYRMCGEGDMPLESMLGGLVSAGFAGYASLEWVKRWSAGLESAGIVFPQYANFMKPYHRRHKHDLQTDERGTGKYIWPKERLIDYTFPEILDRVCEEFPNQYAFRYTELDYTRTYPEFRDDVDTFARALI